MIRPEGRRLVLRGASLPLATVAVAVLTIVFIERQPIFPSARLIECLILALVSAAAAWVARGRLRNTLVVTCSLIVGLAALEGGVLVANMMTHQQPGAAADDSGLAQYRAVLGWGAVKPGVYRSSKTAADGQPIFDTHVTIDDTLNRKTVPSTGPRPIVFFGDSWIYGDGVEDNGTLPQAFADLNHRQIPVLNLAFAGWSPAQNLVALQKGFYASLIKAPRHFVLFTATFHLERTACKGSYAFSQAPRFVLEGDRLTYAGPCGRLGLLAPVVRIARRFALYQRIAPMFAVPSRHDMETYVKVIETFVATSQRDYGVRTTVLFAPFKDQYIKGASFTENEILAALKADGLDVLVERLPAFAANSPYWIKGDGHPTALFNKLAAEDLEVHLRDVDPDAISSAAASQR